MFLEICAIIFLALFAYYRWTKDTSDYFEKRGIPYRKLDLFSRDTWDLLLKRRSFFALSMKIYNESDSKVYGVFNQKKPVTMIRDPELIQKITIKDFDHFMNHSATFANENDKDNLFDLGLFLLKNERWRDMRNTISPAFTGNKLRLMFQLMAKVANETTTYLKEYHQKQKEQSKEALKGENHNNNDKEMLINMKDFITRYTNDVIASTAFGLEVNSFKHENNEFYLAGKRVTHFTLWQNIKFFLFIFMRKIVQILKIDMFDKKAQVYFKNIVLDAMKYRQKHSIFRPDLINLLMEARGLDVNGSNKSDIKMPKNREWSDNEMVAQCFSFFFAGFDTTATLICFVAQVLMENPDVQNKLYKEIQTTEEELTEDCITYETIQKMTYMDMVVMETLRKWSPGFILDRLCTKEFKYELDNGMILDFKIGDRVWIPCAGIQNDPKYFPNPTKFDPERFNEKNKHNIKPCTYMPFGSGPRLCIASRFAQLEAKVLIYYLLRDFHIEYDEKSFIKTTDLFDRGFQVTPKKGFWFKLVPRH